MAVSSKLLAHNRQHKSVETDLSSKCAELFPFAVQVLLTILFERTFVADSPRVEQKTTFDSVSVL